MINREPHKQKVVSLESYRRPRSAPEPKAKNPHWLWWALVIAIVIGCCYAAARGDELDDKKQRLECLECASRTSVLDCKRECAAYRQLKARMHDGSDVDVQDLVNEVERTRPLVVGFRAIIADQKRTIAELKSKLSHCKAR